MSRLFTQEKIIDISFMMFLFQIIQKIIFLPSLVLYYYMKNIKNINKRN